LGSGTGDVSGSKSAEPTLSGVISGVTGEVGFTGVDREEGDGGGDVKAVVFEGCTVMLVGVDKASPLGSCSDSDNVLILTAELAVELTVDGVTGKVGVGDCCGANEGEVDGVGDVGAVVLGSWTGVDDGVESPATGKSSSGHCCKRTKI